MSDAPRPAAAPAEASDGNQPNLFGRDSSSTAPEAAEAEPPLRRSGRAPSPGRKSAEMHIRAGEAYRAGLTRHNNNGMAWFKNVKLVKTAENSWFGIRVTSLDSGKVFIKAMREGSLAELDGRMSAGDQVLEVNGATSAEEMVRYLRESDTVLIKLASKGITEEQEAREAMAIEAAAAEAEAVAAAAAEAEALEAAEAEAQAEVAAAEAEAAAEAASLAELEAAMNDAMGAVAEAAVETAELAAVVAEEAASEAESSGHVVETADWFRGQPASSATAQAEMQAEVRAHTTADIPNVESSGAAAAGARSVAKTCATIVESDAKGTDGLRGSQEKGPGVLAGTIKAMEAQMASLLESYPAPDQISPLDALIMHEPSVYTRSTANADSGYEAGSALSKSNELKVAHRADSLGSATWGAGSYSAFMASTSGRMGRRSAYPQQLEKLLQEEPALWQGDLQFSDLNDANNSPRHPIPPTASVVNTDAESCIKLLQFEKATLQHTVQLQRGHCDRLVELMAKAAPSMAAAEHVSDSPSDAQETELTELRSELLCTKKVTSLQEEYCQRLVEVAQDAESRLSAVSDELMKVKSKAKKRLLSDRKQLQQQQQEIQKLTAALLERDTNYSSQPQLTATTRVTTVADLSEALKLPEDLNKRIEDNARHMVKAAVANKRRSKSHNNWKGMSSGVLSPQVRSMMQDQHYP